MNITPILKENNPEIARVIRTVLEEFNVNKPGTVYTDPTTGELYELFESEAKSMYWVVEIEGEIVGGAGIFPTKGLDANCVELVKLYLLKKHRGKGIGEELMRMCIVEAENMLYNKIYLETLPELHNAIGLYEKMGFHKLDKPLGDSGHFACDLWMIKEI
jgi:putative acetyltransferase|tara:strand:+ start:30116 stop:30595 length:480 start_codon:yes stop_codon:yes gene_type:complete